ncbi:MULTISPECIES: hypothetical protein [unclassified Simplicispira]|uniref:hypothetical protein n=1 Tax=unclassified Simplicispira TaxID=2630407 RepID=UPI000D5ECB8C|nr:MULTISPECIES: hypothetical protein [unclassified Simplicispira]PVY57604.1 hypothetical protein C8D04_2898 [Simplicispira sp. 125]REG18548.1 hypothetical protein C8D01_3209 [Simplicispira sp. 110]
MSLFSWFTRKPASAQSRMAEPSGLLNADATVPMVPGRDGRPVAQAVPAEHAANRKNERMERRELLYAVVRDAMVRAAVLSASYKFKVLSLDQRGRQFLVMMDLTREYGGDTARLSEIEALIAQTAKTRYDIAVNAVYWRLNDHVAVGVPMQGVASARAPVAAQPRPPAAVPARSPAVAPAAPVVRAAIPAAVAAVAAVVPTPRAEPARFDPIEADEVAAFKQALASAGRPAATAAPGVPVRSGPMRSSPLLHNDFADTEMPESDSRQQDLSGTQYGDL